MKILRSDTGEKSVPILKQHTYVSITDFGLICFLKEVKIGPAQHSWEWVSVVSDKCLDISKIGNKYCSFDYAINRAVNDMYCTVYEFNNFKEVADRWEDIKYEDCIRTIYKS